MVARTGTIACSGIEKKQSDWFSLILVAKKLSLVQLPELTARSPVNARFQLGFRAAHALIAHCLVAQFHVQGKARFKYEQLETLVQYKPWLTEDAAYIGREHDFRVIYASS